MFYCFCVYSLAPNPYYPAFDHDFLDLGQVAVIEVNNHAYADISIINSTDTNDKAFTLSCCITREALEEAYIRSESSGHPPRGLLLTNPSNPLGIIYSEKEIRMAIDWAASKCPPLHVIADEIYALSVFETTNSDNIDCDHNSVSSSSTNSHQPFVSIVKMLENKLGNHVHFLWSLSKDFGGSGLRCGVMYSQNRSLLQAMGACNDTMMVSNLMQHVAGCLLQDTPFIEAYLRENRTRLFRSYTFLRSNLLALDIPVIDASGGLFLFANFRKYLSVDSFEGEISLQEELATSCGIVLTPGKSCHCQVPGYFRICYAWVPLSSLEEAIRRLQKMYKSRL